MLRSFNGREAAGEIVAGHSENVFLHLERFKNVHNSFFTFSEMRGWMRGLGLLDAPSLAGHQRLPNQEPYAVTHSRMQSSFSDLFDIVFSEWRMTFFRVFIIAIRGTFTMSLD